MFQTRILVTHNISILPHVDTIVVMKNGTISEIGMYNQLKSKLGDFSELVQSYSNGNTQEPVKDSQGK